MSKTTMAEKRAAAHRKRIADRLHNRSMPKIALHIGLCGVSVVSDVDGNLYRIDADAGTINRLHWEK